MSCDGCYRLERECTKDCIINGIEFKKGDFVFIPVNAVHSFPEHFPNPEVFDPERYVLRASVCHCIHDSLAMKFGEGIGKLCSGAVIAPRM